MNIPCLTLLLWICLCTTSLISSEMYIGEETNTWSNASNSCRGNNPVGGEEMKFCKPEKCMPGKLSDIKGIPMERNVLWLNGYVVRSPLLQHEDCYELKKGLEDNVTTKTTFDKNSASKCAIFCSVEKKGNPGDFIYLQDNNCYCVSSETHDSWLNTSLIKIRETNACKIKCTGGEFDRCGGNHADEVKDIAFYSVYVFRADNIKSKITKLDEIDHHCISVDVQSELKYTSCKEKLKFNCTSKIGSREKGVRQHDTCTHNEVSWYDARNICKIKKSFIRTPNGTSCGSELSKWHGSFRTEEIIWNSILKDPAYERKCLALSVKRDKEFRLLALECNERYQTLCIKHNDTSDSPSAESTEVPSTDIPFEENTEVPLTEIIIGSIFAILFTAITIAVVFLKTKVCKTVKERDPQRKQNVSYSTVKNNTGSEMVPQNNGNSQYNYVDIPTENCLSSDGDVYNHLRDDVVTTVTGNVYGHVGTIESEYDISATSTTKPNSEEKDTLYDHTRTIQTDIYDTTDTRSNMDNRT